VVDEVKVVLQIEALVRDDLLVEQTGQPPSYDELAVLVMVLKAKLYELAAENVELSGVLGLNSREP
jgi:hypothetical protein